MVVMTQQQHQLIFLGYQLRINFIIFKITSLLILGCNSSPTVQAADIANTMHDGTSPVANDATTDQSPETTSDPQPLAPSRCKHLPAAISIKQSELHQPGFHGPIAVGVSRHKRARADRDRVSRQQRKECRTICVPLVLDEHQ